MAEPTWQLEGNHAWLKSAWLAGRVDATRPDRGLFDVLAAPGELDGGQLLGFAMPSLDLGEAASPVGFLARGAELLVGYEASEGWPVRVDAAWRIVPPSSAGEVYLAMDLLLSVRTESLQSCPRLAVETVLAADQVFSAADPESGRFEPRTSRSMAFGGSSSQDFSACFVFRFPGGQFSYAQMLRAGDCRRDELTAEGEASSPVRIRHWLFGQSLERGVILRTRVRGLFLPRDRDLELARKCFADFAAAGPPLGT